MLISGNVSELSLDDDFLTPHDISSPRRRSSVGSNDRIIIIREGRWAGIAVYTNHEDFPRLTTAILSTIHLAPFSNLLIITNSLANRTIRHIRLPLQLRIIRQIILRRIALVHIIRHISH